MVFSLKFFGCHPGRLDMTAEEFMECFRGWQKWLEIHSEDMGAMAGLMGMV